MMELICGNGKRDSAAWTFTPETQTVTPSGFARVNSKQLTALV